MNKLKWILPLLGGILLLLGVLSIPFIGLYNQFGMSAVFEVLGALILVFVIIIIGASLIAYAISYYLHHRR